MIINGGFDVIAGGKLIIVLNKVNMTRQLIIIVEKNNYEPEEIKYRLQKNKDDP